VLLPSASLLNVDLNTVPVRRGQEDKDKFSVTVVESEACLDDAPVAENDASDVDTNSSVNIDVLDNDNF